MYCLHRTNTSSVIAQVWNIWVLSIITPTDKPTLATKENRQETEGIDKETTERSANEQKCDASSTMKYTKTCVSL